VNIRLPNIPREWRERGDWFPRGTTMGQLLLGFRWGAIVAWAGALVVNWSRYGIPFDRTGLLLWIAIGLAASCIGRHPVWLLWVVIDFAPLAAVLIVYDRLRGLADTVGLPTWWHPQIEVDRFLFAGHEPTVWLQEHLKHATAQWYDVAVAICYFSFFFLPYLLAGVMWLRSRADFYRWSLRFVALSFLGFTLFVLIPAAPPWAAARCDAVAVASHPNNPSCLYNRDLQGGLLGHFSTHQPGANPYVELITTRGFGKLHLSVASSLVEHGRGYADAVAAVPSLHLGGTMLFVLFMWPRLNKWWRPLLVAYPVLMMFSLAYGGDHYVADGIAGALCAALVHWGAGRIERQRRRSRAPDTLESPPESTQESPCPPTSPPPPKPLRAGTSTSPTPSST
jgi:hypothetical protein